ncbi:MAG: threonine synthase [Candidatus Aminicenantes bacterium]|nr:threonine synthase [Candidatus Aminicenantes bacterium]
MDKLSCSRCGIARSVDVFGLFCPRCGDPMVFSTARRKPRIREDEPLGAGRYIDFLPLPKFDPALSLGEGGTPLQRLLRLERRFRLPRLHAKNESMNPTGSFKDRGSAVAVPKAVRLGFGTVGTISTGNMAGSTAAYAAKAGLRSVIFVKEDTAEEKILAAAVYGARVVKVRGEYASLFRKSFEIGRSRGVYFANSVDPFRLEGYKVTSFEIFEQLGRRAPGFVFVPVSAGGHLVGLYRGFEDLRAAGYLKKGPKFVGVQALGCAPVARAFERRAEAVRPFPRPRTIAHAISNPLPPGGNLVLKLLAESGGATSAVSDDEILRAQRLLAEEEGIFCDPASATTLAAVLRLARRSAFAGRERIVLVITGSGLKTLEDLDPARLDIREADLESLDDALVLPAISPPPGAPRPKIPYSLGRTFGI